MPCVTKNKLPVSMYTRVKEIKEVTVYTSFDFLCSKHLLSMN